MPVLAAVTEALTPFNLVLAFAAGVATFASPCMLPLVPGYLAMLGATPAAAGEAGEDGERRAALSGAGRNALLFIAGFTLVFTLLGFGSGVLGGALVRHRREIETVGGILVIAFGVLLLVSDRLPMALQNRRGARLTRPSGSGLSAFGFGVVFAAAWSPCIGPTLGAILTVAASGSNAVSGAVLLAVFSLGIGLPFAALGLGLHGSTRVLTWLRRHQRGVRVGSAAMLIAFGVLLATGTISALSTELSATPGIEL